MNSVAIPTKGFTYRFNVGQIQKTLCPSDKTRSAVVVCNESGVLFVKLGYGVSETDYTYKLFSSMILEIVAWAGPVTAVRSTGSGWVQCTETV